jgi:acyl-CoA thioester hydrolase
MSRAPFHSRGAYRHWTRITTRFLDNDAYGHVNNTVFYTWFDTAVNAWLIQAGLLELADGNLIGLVVETGCRYARPLSFPSAVDIGLVIDRIGNSSVTFRLGVFDETAAAAAAEGTFTHVYVDREMRRPTPLPDRWRTVLATLQQAAPQ